MKIKEQSKKIRSQDTDFYFDDCAICRSLKEAENRGRDLTATELKQTFKEAENRGAVVGGPLLEDHNEEN